MTDAISATASVSVTASSSSFSIGNVKECSNGHASQEIDSSSDATVTTVTGTGQEAAAPTAPSTSLDQINEQRRIFLKSTIQEEDLVKEEQQQQQQNNGESAADATATPPEEASPQLRRQTPPASLALSVKYATLPSPNVVSSVTVRSPLSPPPKPPMLSRTRSTGSGDARTPLANGDTPAMRHSVAEAIPTKTSSTSASITTPTPVPNPNPASSATGTAASTPAKTDASDVSASSSQLLQQQQSPRANISAKHYESLIEELRCPGCASPMKAPVLLCRSGHSVCEQCTRILLMCPLCKEGFTNSRSLTIEALCAKAHFGCSHSAGGCNVRMPVALLPWHEQQCIFKPMKCFMGRVWGECRWHGREVQWKEHLEEAHADKLFNSATANLVWNMDVRRKPLTGYYVFQAHDEMFNFYEIHDKQRILFTMTCTSNRRDTKYNYAYEVTLLQPDNDAVSLTQKFPVHSEYDRDILMEGTCVTIGLNELARFVDDEKVLHYRVNVMAVKSPRRLKPARQSLPLGVEYQTRLIGVNGNGKSVPANMIITKTYKEAMGELNSAPVTPSTPDTEDDNAIGQDLERKWGTPQLHFNRKYLRNTHSADGNGTDLRPDELRPLQETRANAGANDDKLSLCSNSTSYTKKISDSLRRSFRTLKSDLVEMRPFTKKKCTLTTAAAPTSKT